MSKISIRRSSTDLGLNDLAKRSQSQWRIRISLGGDTNNPDAEEGGCSNSLFGKKIARKCMKMKEIGPL